MITHSLAKPLNYFHTKFVSIFNELPKNEKTLEITKRVIIAVASLFAYPVFGCVYLMGRFYDSCVRSESGTTPKACINVSEKMKELKQSLLQGISKVETIDTIQSVKIFFKLKVDGDSFIKEFVVTKKNQSAIDDDFLSQSIEPIIKQLGELMREKTYEKLDFTWVALIKNINANFSTAHESVSAEGNSSSGNTKNISSEQVNRLFPIFLQRIGKNIPPQINEQWEFV